MKKACMICLLIACCATGYAQSEISDRLTVDLAWYPSNHKGYESTGFAPVDFSLVPKEDLITVDDGRDLGKQGYEGILTYTHTKKYPFMQGSGPLSMSNNLEVQLSADLSPVSAGASVKTILTPVAFMNFDASLYAGSGWTVAGLNGLALNTVSDPYEPTPLGGIYLKAETGTSLQFDFAALNPGDWNHVVTVYRPGVEYQLNTAAEVDEPWQWQADPGENFNGWNWKQALFLGYRTPALLRLNTIGLLMETEQRITRRDDSIMDDGGWGSDFMQVYIASIVVLDLKENHSLTIQAQFARERDYTDATVGNESFLNRAVDAANQTYWYFRRIAFSYSLSF